MKRLIFFLEEPSAEEMLKSVLPKIAGSRAIAPHLSIESNASHSFRILMAGIRKLLEDARWTA